MARWWWRRSVGEIEREDLRLAVAESVITADQSERIIDIAARRRAAGDAEPITLLRGFNEVYVVMGIVALFVGLGMLLYGYPPSMYVDADSLDLRADADDLSAYFRGELLYSGVRAAVALGLFTYFYRVRAMMGPGVLLTGLFVWSMAMTGFNGAWLSDPAAVEYSPQYPGSTTEVLSSETLYPMAALVVAALAATLSAAALYWWSRIPFALFALGAAAVAAARIVAEFLSPTRFAEFEVAWPQAMFDLGFASPAAEILLVAGMIGLAAALSFDMSDPRRATSRAANAFWLHLLAGPALVNVLAMTLYQAGGAGGAIGLVALFVVVIMLTLVIDRRSFLISAFGYMIALAAAGLGDGQAVVAVIVIAVSLLLLTLGAFWAGLRRWLMEALPDFPGKSRLPPYA
jgi:hypothetical protein